MGNSHTAIIEAEDGSFEEFVWSCARAIDFNGRMRNEPRGLAIPVYTPNTSYDSAQLKVYEELLVSLNAMTPADAQRRADEQYRVSLAQWEDTCEKDRRRRAKYLAMLERVEDWHPPTVAHQRLKGYMLEQIKWETEILGEEGMQRRRPERQDPAEPLRRRIDSLESDIRRLRERIAEEIQDVAAANDWNAELAKSVPPVFKGR